MLCFYERLKLYLSKHNKLYSEGTPNSLEGLGSHKNETFYSSLEHKLVPMAV